MNSLADLGELQRTARAPKGIRRALFNAKLLLHPVSIFGFPVVLPSLSDFYLEGLIGISEPKALLSRLKLTDEISVRTYESELNEILSELIQGSVPAKRRFPSNYDLMPTEAQVVYSVVRATRPYQVVETGVGNGLSTRVILSALEKNAFGQLLSFEVDPEAGILARDLFSNRWTLHLLPKRAREREFTQTMNGLNSLDLFIHDSEHTYRQQSLEYAQAYLRLRPRGYLMSDDIDASYAFLDFVSTIPERPKVLLTPRSLFGLFQKAA